MKLSACIALLSVILSAALSVTLGATATVFAAGTDATPTAPAAAAAANDLDEGRNAVKAKAEEHLARLDKICGKGCDEYNNLQKTVETFTMSGGVPQNYGS